MIGGALPPQEARETRALCSLRRHTAQHAQPSAPQNVLRSATGSLLDAAAA
jgi:hypothetical protein